MWIGTPCSITLAGKETEGVGETACRGEGGRLRAEREKEPLCWVDGELDCE
jgi:hypothetical protein